MAFRALFPATAVAGAASLMYSNQKRRENLALSAVESLELSRPAVRATSGAGEGEHDASYYMKCMVGGLLSCGLTHTAVVPLDIVKCRMQTNPEVYTGLFSGLSKLSAEGTSSLAIGWLPTFIGYSMQGVCKFGFYELFKDVYAGAIGEPNATTYRQIVWLAASASAEFIADIALVPMEAIKVRMQTSPAEAKFPTDLGSAMARVNAEEGTAGFYKSLQPLWGRQIPYTMIKFFAFQQVVEMFYTYFLTRPKEEYSKVTQLGVTFGAGYIAGVFCAVVSHPADTIVSKLNQNDSATIGGIVEEMGMYNLATKGLGVRILMIGTLTGLQWWIYDTFKTMVGLKTTGGAVKKEIKDSK